MRGVTGGLEDSKGKEGRGGGIGGRGLGRDTSTNTFFLYVRLTWCGVSVGLGSCSSIESMRFERRLNGESRVSAFVRARVFIGVDTVKSVSGLGSPFSSVQSGTAFTTSCKASGGLSTRLPYVRRTLGVVFGVVVWREGLSWPTKFVLDSAVRFEGDTSTSSDALRLGGMSEDK